MRSIRTFTALAAALALAAGGQLTAAAPASAAAPLSCDQPSDVTDNGGHRGVAITCRGDSFTGWVRCQKGELTYKQYGNRALSGGLSTTWCDQDGVPVAAGGDPA
ncbi:hypothetical protein [Streptomyces sp. AK02-01A]|uniref:hypothetical protein n=1 Tax=Streptomyces sp. AK02-01A TaxID=3028648 RepID=UPI0029B38616|nr:hypothetical protein [Streptomyces sp. AK02-01A]MDX3854656.1 hypothetical protein [Streptomyces sp. AK02-01A]